MKLKCNEGGTPHPEGIFPAVCVDVIDLGYREVEYRGEKKMVQKLRIVFETMDGEPRLLSRTLTASLHPKSRMAELLGKWRGKPYLPGEETDTDNLIGVSATLVVSHQQKFDGSGIFASIDAVSRPTKKVTPSGTYNPTEAREKIRMYDAKAGKGPAGQGQAAAPQEHVRVCENRGDFGPGHEEEGPQF